MDWNISNMQYPLEERIGDPSLLVGRKDEFVEYQKWISGIPKKRSKSLAILARKKSGKTAFVQRLFNKLWSMNGEVIPFYMEIPGIKTWLPDLATKYYCAFASQYISFLEQDPLLVKTPLDLEEIQNYGEKKSLSLFVRDATKLEKLSSKGLHGLMWDIAYEAPHRYAGVYERPVLVILNLLGY